MQRILSLRAWRVPAGRIPLEKPPARRSPGCDTMSRAVHRVPSHLVCRRRPDWEKNAGWLFRNQPATEWAVLPLSSASPKCLEASIQRQPLSQPALRHRMIWDVLTDCSPEGGDPNGLTARRNKESQTCTDSEVIDYWHNRSSHGQGMRNWRNRFLLFYFVLLLLVEDRI